MLKAFKLGRERTSLHHSASDELKSRKDFELSLVRFSNPLLDVGWLLLISAKLHCNVENGGDALIRRTLVPLGAG